MSNPSAMATNPINSVTTRTGATQLPLLLALVFSLYTASTWHRGVAAVPEELLRGFTATPDPSISSFQPLLTDSTQNFSLGFLRVNHTHLALSVLHVPSSEPLWQANIEPAPRWSKSTQLTFNGSIVISDHGSRVFWSTGTDGDRAVLLNTSNLQVQSVESAAGTHPVVWQAFDFPADTLVQEQNFTSAMALLSSNGRYSMRLGDKFFGLYANLKENDTGLLYLKHTALEAKAEIKEGEGPIYARVNPDGFLGMYQTGDDKIPVDVESFSTFQRVIPGIFLRIRLESDGNLKGYYWDGSRWVVGYQAIREQCDLPSPCGAYGLCQPGSGCSCLVNQTDTGSEPGVCVVPGSGDFCSVNPNVGIGFRELWRKRVELPAYKELMEFERLGSLERCESACRRNCSCWGALYNNASGSCYLINYPIQTMVEIGDEGKTGYFKIKVTKRVNKGPSRVGAGIGLALLCITAVILTAMLGLGGFKIWERKKGVSGSGYMAEQGGLSPGRYKTLESSGSSGSIEMGRT